MSKRSDARHNRERVLQAAEEVFREVGATAPLSLVANRAGVGRATLYRNFPDRTALVAGVFEKRFEKLVDLAADWDGDDLLEQLLVEITWYEHDLPGLGTLLRSASSSERTQLEPVVSRVHDLLAFAVERAVASGAVQSNVTIADAFAAIAMLEGIIASVGVDRIPSQSLHRGFEIVLRGLRAAERQALPTPRPVLR